MNTRKKIIYTLRSADKASVERLMAEAAKKDEIFAKVMERTEKDNKYTDVAEGTEQYNRKIRIVHSASAAAASILLVAGVWGTVHLLRSHSGFFEHRAGDSNVTMNITDNHNSSTTDNVLKITGTTAANATSAGGSVTIVTAAATTDVTTSENKEKITESATSANITTEATTDADAQQPEQKETGEQLREKCISAVYNYDRFSADFTFSKTMNDSELFRYSEGTVKIDNSSMTGEFDQKIYASDGRLYRDERQFYLNDKFAYAGDYGTGGLDAKITKMTRELPEGSIFDRVYFQKYMGMVTFTKDNLNDTRWEITGERNENGRNITSVMIRYGDDNSSDVITADIDTETGICLSYDKYQNGRVIESLRTSNCKFEENAEAPMTEREVKEFLESSDYESGMLPIYSDYQISDLN